MAERTRDGGVEECKGFSPLPTTNASLSRVPLGSLDSSTRVPNTGTATPQRLRRTEPQKSADLARKGAKYAQRTEGQRLMPDAHKIRTSNILLYTGYNPWCKINILCRHTSCCTNTLIDPILFFTATIMCRIDFHALRMNKFEHRILRIEPTAVHRCARKSTEFASQ